MDKFSDYGFPRSHAVAYAYLAFQTAYLKAHYPEHFYAAVLSSEAQDAAKVFKYSKELRTQGIMLLPPDVNESLLRLHSAQRCNSLRPGGNKGPRAIDGERDNRSAQGGSIQIIF